MMNNKTISKITIILTILLFVISLTQKAYVSRGDDMLTILAFLFGWFPMLMDLGNLLGSIIGLFTGSGSTTAIGSSFSWLANPLMLLAMIFIKRNIKLAIWFSSLAVLFALSILVLDHVIATEAGHYSEIESMEAGYWLWLTSAFVLLIGVLKLNDSI